MLQDASHGEVCNISCRRSTPTRGRRTVCEEVFDRLGCERLGEEESLGEVASLELQRLDLAVLLDSLGERLQAERLAELDQGVRERVRLARERQSRDEGTVDLQLIDGKLAQVGERAVPRPEVVDRDPNAESLPLAQQLSGGIGPAHQDRLGDLERQRRRVETACVKRCTYLLDELRALELSRGDVDRHVQGISLLAPRG